tara:strand:- start:3842 stop:4363 length:522 start_codon:yes stop_codon:yes gene_type:complete
MSSKKLLLKAILIIFGGCIIQYFLNESKESDLKEDLNNYTNRLIVTADLLKSYKNRKPEIADSVSLLSDTDTKSINMLIYLYNDLYGFNFQEYDQKSSYYSFDRIVTTRISERQEFLIKQLYSIKGKVSQLYSYKIILILSCLILLAGHRLVDRFMRDPSSIDNGNRINNQAK